MAPSVFTVAKLAFVASGALISAVAVAPRDTPLSESGNCTYTALRIPEFTWGPVETVWTTVVTSTLSVDCGNCSHVATSLIPIGHGLEVSFTETVTAADASTKLALACQTAPAKTTSSHLSLETSASASQGEPNHDVVVLAAFSSSFPLVKKSTSDHKVVVAATQTVPSVPSVPPQQGELHQHKAAGYRRSQDQDDDENENENEDTDMNATHTTTPFALRGFTSTITAPGVPSPTCTTTFALAPNRPRATLTIYPSTVTHTSRVYCGSCALIWSTNLSDLPTTPMVYVATKTTKKPATETHLACHKFTVKSTKKPTAASPTATTTTTGDHEKAPSKDESGDQHEMDDKENDDEDG